MSVSPIRLPLRGTGFLRKKHKGIIAISSPAALSAMLNSFVECLKKAKLDLRAITDEQAQDVLAKALQYVDAKQQQSLWPSGEAPVKPTSITTIDGLYGFLGAFKANIKAADIDLRTSGHSTILNQAALALGFESLERCIDEWRKAEFVSLVMRRYGYSEEYANACYLSTRRSVNTTTEQLINSFTQRGC